MTATTHIVQRFTSYSAARSVISKTRMIAGADRKHHCNARTTPYYKRQRESHREHAAERRREVPAKQSVTASSARTAARSTAAAREGSAARAAQVAAGTTQAASALTVPADPDARMSRVLAAAAEACRAPATITGGTPAAFRELRGSCAAVLPERRIRREPARFSGIAFNLTRQTAPAVMPASRGSSSCNATASCRSSPATAPEQPCPTTPVQTCAAGSAATFAASLSIGASLPQPVRPAPAAQVVQSCTGCSCDGSSLGYDGGS